ncbi:MAG: xanthine dehydrogenase molybdopterin binding subunit [Bacteroidales bacterium]|nr:xanthine dehydrogenase molybdopterin binding subunit [Bacteroidales bacterium]
MAPHKENSKNKSASLESFSAHNSAVQHVSGEATFINDISTGTKILYGHIVYSPYAAADICSINLEEAIGMPGIHAILSAKDIPGENQMGAVVKDEPCLAKDEVAFIGQAVLLIAADDKRAAIAAEEKIMIEYRQVEAVHTLTDAINKNLLLSPARKIEAGDVNKALTDCDHVLSGELFTGPQEHWYLETQSCLTVPVEGREFKVYSSTQHPSETQTIISDVLGVSKNSISVEVRRVGGAFGGKETQANHIAAWASLLAWETNCPVKIHLDRDTDQIITGKRHPFLSNYKIGFSSEGLIKAFDVELNADAGSSTDLTNAILGRALFHVDNAYFIPNLRVIGRAWKTNKPSNTAFRGFGAPQGMAVIEQAIDRMARFLGKDPAMIRKINFYGETNNNITHYGEAVENNRLHKLWDQLTESSSYEGKMAAVQDFNIAHKYKKRGLALTPVKFGISFTTTFLNQAGALVNIYTDGSVIVNHGGIEMGQGLHTKIRRVAALELGIDEAFIRLSPSCTDLVPNTSATAASSGADMNGMAVKNACLKLKSRLAEAFINKMAGTGMPDIDSIQFENNKVFFKEKKGISISFQELVNIAYHERYSLSATGFYRTPDIYFNRAEGKGRPFHYFAFGMAVSMVEVDTLTGYVRLMSSDILHDVGDSLHPMIDMGQVRGGFIQGVGWCTTEDIKYDAKGMILNHSPDTYKIPTIMDIPEDFIVNLMDHVPNPNTIRKSKAVGEPPFMLAFSVWLAIKDAISATAGHKKEPGFSLPATNEVILQSIEKLRK